ncbi:MAG TPA: hypothetical protein VE954_13630 [Oligoflexus sp.]|uniref:hypothetical protein n=1 Tax=Oligoflexus sp. TaxID=1971216 RepID=UPI002D659866|nr:hypothetical protein [Oligoflexus sp.]HYX34140.1 hypothetical protein [Oligoflexus sp.]
MIYANRAKKKGKNKYNHCGFSRDHQMRIPVIALLLTGACSGLAACGRGPSSRDKDPANTQQDTQQTETTAFKARDADETSENSPGTIPWVPQAEARTAAPDIVPSLAVVTYVGGTGNQYIRNVSIADDGSVTAEGKGFRVIYSPGLTSARVEGDANTPDADAYSDKPTLYKEWNTNWSSAKHAKKFDDPRSGLSYYFGTRHVHANLMQPTFLVCKTGTNCDASENQEARMWDWWASVAFDKSLGADSRGYDVFPLPNGMVGLKGWTDGGNSTLARWPVRDDPNCKNAASCPQLDIKLEDNISKGTFQAGPNSLSTMYMVYDPAQKKPVLATFLRSHVTHHAVDAWGRIYLPKGISRAFPTRDPDNLFGHSKDAETGLFVLSRDFTKAEINTRIGGTCRGDGKLQSFAAIAQKGNLLVLGGTTCANDLAVTGTTVQTKNGGAQDGMLVIIKLWE